jgi:LysR family glycine cleavage system transcriptional activator
MHKLRNILGPLRVLDAVHRAGGVARAAERLHVTPGAVSHQIRALETALDTRLCRKTGREAVLTPSGLQLALRVAELFDRVEEAVQEASSRGKARRIRLKVIPSFAIKWLMPRLAGFYALHADIDLEVATVTRADDVGLDDADFVVRRGHGRWPGTHAERLFDDVLALACTPQMAAGIHAPRDVLSHKLLHSMIAPAGWETWLAAAGLPAEQARMLPLANAALCLQAAVQGVGVALTQQAYMCDEVARGVLVNPLAQTLRSGEAYYLVSAPGTMDLRPYADFSAWVKTVAQSAADAGG